MYICICQGVTDGQIRRAVQQEGCASYREVRESLGIAHQCSKCGCVTKQLVRELLADQQRAAEPLQWVSA